MENSIKSQIIAEIDKALLNHQIVRVYYKNQLFSHYSDANGQRDHFLGNYHYGKEIFQKENPKMKFSGVYTVYRKLSFTNDSDICKEFAVLGVINVNKCTDTSISHSAKKETITCECDYLRIEISSKVLDLPINNINKINQEQIGLQFEKYISNLGWKKLKKLRKQLKKIMKDFPF